jgi:hypothetical protein
LERLRQLTEEALPEKMQRFVAYLNQSSDQGVTQLLSAIDNEMSMIEERIDDLNLTLRRVDFQRGCYLRLQPRRVVHESLRELQQAQRQLRSAELKDDQGESHFHALRHMVALLRDASERHRTLMTQLLDVLFDGEVDNLGLEGFLGALDDTDHWLLIAPLGRGLLPFRQLRIRAKELMAATLPGSRVLVVENESSLYQLPQVSDTVAILGAGLNLGWLEAPRFDGKQLAYWGDLDTWGLQMLATARVYRPQLRALLMTRDILDAYAALSAVPELSPAAESPPIALTESESMLYRHMLTLERGRLEQEFLPADQVHHAVATWGGVHPTSGAGCRWLSRRPHTSTSLSSMSKPLMIWK